MANNIALAQKYVADPENFQGVFAAATLTGDLTTQDVVFTGAKTVKMPFYNFSLAAGADLPNYNRATGTTLVDLIETWKELTLSQDKGPSLYIDEMDDEETLGQGIIKRVNEFIRTRHVPAVDKYRFSVAFKTPTPATDPTVVGAKIVVGNILTKDNVLDAIDAAFEYQSEQAVTKEGLVLYIKPSARTLLQRAKDLSRQIVVQNVSINNVNTVIETYNGAKIVEVPSAILGTDIDFALVQPKALASCVKYNASKILTGESLPGKFGYQWDHRFYYDLFHSEGKAIIEGTGSNKTLVNPGVYVYKGTQIPTPPEES
jgi:hypothetical protein